MLHLDFVIPVYNEAGALPSFHASLRRVVGSIASAQVRVIYVNDGSTDSTREALAAIVASDPQCRALELSRNFGHQAALSAGLDVADADAIVMMDGDGQHPPDLVPEMVRLFELGYEVVQTQRIDHARSFKRATSRSFYWLISTLGEVKLAEGAADFRLISRRVLQAVREIREYHRFYRGIFPWLGFRTVLLPYSPAARLAGTSKYSFRKMLRLAGDGMFSFSLLPLRLGVFLGGVFLCAAIAEAAFVLAAWLTGRQNELVPGWSSVIVLSTSGLGVIMVLLGFIGIYVGMIFQEVKRRPVYVVRATEEGSGAERAATTAALNSRAE